MKKIKRLFVAYTLILTMILSIAPAVKAQGTERISDSDNDIIICATTTEDVSSVTRAGYKYVTVKRTSTFKNASGKALWYVTLQATFQYNGTNSGCTSAKVTAGSYNSNWKVSDKRTSVSGATATAYATGRLYSGSTLIQTVPKSVSLYCSPSGKVS